VWTLSEPRTLRVYLGEEGNITAKESLDTNYGHRHNQGTKRRVPRASSHLNLNVFLKAVMDLWHSPCLSGHQRTEMSCAIPENGRKVEDCTTKALTLQGQAPAEGGLALPERESAPV